jgi:hypothetical protein
VHRYRYTLGSTLAAPNSVQTPTETQYRSACTLAVPATASMQAATDTGQLACKTAELQTHCPTTHITNSKEGCWLDWPGTPE